MVALWYDFQLQWLLLLLDNFLYICTHLVGWWEGCVGFEKLIQKFGLFPRSAQLSWDAPVKLRSLNWITFHPCPAGKSTRTDGCKSCYAKVSKLLEFLKDQPF